MVLIIVVSSVFLLFLILCAATVFFYNVGISRRKKEFLADSPDLVANQATELPVLEEAWVERQVFEDVNLTSFDGLLLRGYYLEARVSTSNIVVLVHGYGGAAKENMGTFARLYHEEHNFHVLMLDCRGHGASEGSYIGFGWHDRLDCKQWIEYLIQRHGSASQIVLHGLSMGGATVLMASGEPLPEQVKCIVSDCAYTSVREILSHQLGQMYKLPPFPIVPLTSLYCKMRAGFFFEEASTLDQLKKASLPILFIHGGADTFVPTEMVHRLYAVCPVVKEKLVIPGAGHGLAYETDPVSYGEKIRHFLRKSLSGSYIEFKEDMI